MKYPIAKREANPKGSQKIGKQIVSYFLQGLLLLAPIVLTVYLIYALLAFLDQLLPIPIPGLGLAIILVFITLIGFLSKNYLFRFLFNTLDLAITRLPLAKIIYTSIQDLFSAFVGDKRKFEEPVLLTLDKKTGVKRLGFITQKDLTHLGLENDVAVYCPHSYNFSGNLFIVPKENVVLLTGLTSADAMKFIVSGGVADIHTEEIIKRPA